MQHQTYAVQKSKKNSQDRQVLFGIRKTLPICFPPDSVVNYEEEQVVFSPSLFKTLELGLRPCSKFTPDIFLQENFITDSKGKLVNQSLKMICDGYLLDHSLTELSNALGITNRYLRKAFTEVVGAPPIFVTRYYKALVAKHLLLTSQQSITEIAFAAGFGSIRQCNDAIKTILHMTPTKIRQRNVPAWCQLKNAASQTPS